MDYFTLDYSGIIEMMADVMKVPVIGLVHAVAFLTAITYYIKRQMGKLI